MAEKKKVLFVGSFKSTSKDGGVGGQMFASKTIINSELKDHIEWKLLDTTADSNILGSLFLRMSKALKRLCLFFYTIIFFRYDYVLIFVADGWSFWEKGLMCLIAKSVSNARVIIAPRSGFIINDLRKKNLKSFIRTVFSKVDVIICQSAYWKGIFLQVLPSESDQSKLIIIENLIDFEKYRELPLRIQEPSEAVNILFMAWVTRNKGIYELIDAVKQLKADGLNFHLTVAGAGSDLERVRKEVDVNGLDRFVSFTGWVHGAEKMRILADADIFVLPTYFDGYPNSLMEAMAAGKACIASRVGSIPDIIDHNRNGLLIEPYESGQLYESLATLINDKDRRFELSIAGRKQIESTNSIPAGINKFMKLFNINSTHG